MGRRGHARRRASRQAAQEKTKPKPKPKTSPPETQQPGTLRVMLERMELARGHDGLLRGGVEPRLLLAAFLMRSGKATLLGRSLTSVGTVTSYPHLSYVDEQALWLGLPRRSEPGAVSLLCLVLEEDSGRDIETLFGDLATPARFVGYDGHTDVPEPVPLAAMMARPSTQAPHAEPIQLLRDGRPLEDTLRHDDWIAASVIRLELAQVNTSTRWSVEARSHDRRNDWTLWLQIGVEV
jgi:hypothetical protein